MYSYIYTVNYIHYRDILFCASQTWHLTVFVFVCIFPIEHINIIISTIHLIFILQAANKCTVKSKYNNAMIRVYINELCYKRTVL